MNRIPHAIGWYKVHPARAGKVAFFTGLAGFWGAGRALGVCGRSEPVRAGGLDRAGTARAQVAVGGGVVGADW
eukprot:COSAG02_NODE_1883_length_10535_cov_4.902070_9_plen_73_part_00